MNIRYNDELAQLISQRVARSLEQEGFSGGSAGAVCARLAL